MKDEFVTGAKYVDEPLQEKGKMTATWYCEDPIETLQDSIDRIEQIKTEMCEYYCRFPYIWDAEQNGCELSESEVCERCPLRRL